MTPLRFTHGRANGEASQGGPGVSKSHDTRIYPKPKEEKKQQRDPFSCVPGFNFSLPSREPAPSPLSWGGGRGTHTETAPRSPAQGFKGQGRTFLVDTCAATCPRACGAGRQRRCHHRHAGQVEVLGPRVGKPHTSATAFAIGSLTLNAPKRGRPRRLSQPSLHRLRAHCIYRLHFLFWLRFCHILK